MKKFIVSLCVVFMVLFVVFAFVGCDLESNKLSTTNENVEYEYVEMLGWQVKITGSITNTTSKNLSYISVEYKIYDSDNAVIGTAIDNANNIGVGETWKFEAMSFAFFKSKPAKVVLSEIQSF